MEIPSVNGQIISNLSFLVFLTLVNAFFSCTEMAVVSVNKNRIGMLAEKGNKKAKLILKLLEEPTNFLSTIQDVYDEEDPLLEKLSEYTYLVDGFYSLNDLNSKLGLKIDNDEFDTISGFVIDLIGRIPEENEKLQVNYKNLSFQILSVKEKCIDKIKMTISPDMVEETSEEEL